jgi:carbonic anhydrase
MKRLLSVSSQEDIPSIYQDSPIGLLLAYHNLQRIPDVYDKAALLIGMCMDNRKRLRMPENFAYVIRAGGANLRYSEFKVSFAIAIGGVKAIALVGHNHCGMSKVTTKKEQFVQGLVKNAGWDADKAEEHFLDFAPQFEIDDEIDFVLSETLRLRQQYPLVQIAPMMYLVEDNLLYLIKEN